MLPMWVLALPIWLVVFIVLYALDSVCRDQVSGSPEISRRSVLCQLGDVLVSVGDRRIASDCLAIRRDRFR